MIQSKDPVLLPPVLVKAPVAMVQEYVVPVYICPVVAQTICWTSSGLIKLSIVSVSVGGVIFVEAVGSSSHWYRFCSHSS